MKKNILIVSITTIIGLVLGYSISFAAVINHAGGFNPIPAYIYCNANFTSGTITAVHDACVEWNNAGRGNLIYSVTPFNNTAAFPCQNDKNEITSGNRGNGYLMSCEHVTEGYTWPWNEWTTYEADIDINTYYKWTNLTPTPSDSLDIGDVITHELGHLLGLGHVTNTNPRATMQEPGAKGQIVRRTIEQDDKDGIQSIY